MVLIKAYINSYARFEGVPIITFYVGQDKIVFHVHQNILFDASPVFKAAFSGSFKEASERSMPLPDDDKDSIGRMIQWLYTRKFHLTAPVSKETSDHCYMELAKLNTLAEKYDIYLLKNHIVDELFALTKPPKNFGAPRLPVVKHVYNNTMARSSFRTLLVAWYAYRIDFNWYELDATREHLAEIPHDFAIDLALELGARQKNPNRQCPFTRPNLDLHEKGPKEPDEEYT